MLAHMFDGSSLPRILTFGIARMREDDMNLLNGENDLETGRLAVLPLFFEQRALRGDYEHGPLENKSTRDFTSLTR